MDKTQKIIVALLIIAIVFSVFSIFFSVSVSNVNIPERENVTPGELGGEGNVFLMIEGSPSGRDGR